MLFASPIWPATVRCHKDAWKQEDIIKFIQNQSAKKFEPKLVELFIQNIVEIQSIRSLSPDGRGVINE